MEICQPFPQFLEEISVISPSQSEKLATSLETEDENATISQLSDFFRDLTPSDYYDLALRLYSFWKKTTSVSPEKKEGAQKITDLVSKKLKQQGLSHLIAASSPPILTVSANLASSYASEGEQSSPPPKKYNAFIGNSIFSSLHIDANRKNYMHVENEQMRLSNETKDCTFQPQLVTNRPSSTPLGVFERLQHDPRKEKESINEVIKLTNETKECTFTPRINPKRLYSEESQEPSNMGTSQTFDRLYKQYQVRRHLSIDNEIKRQSMELKDCTFQPAVSTTRNGSAEADATERYNRLYQLHSERQRSLMKKRMEKLEEEDEKCSFKPHVLPSSARKLGNKDVQERLREWNEVKNLKMEMRAQEKKRSEEKRALNLPAKKKNEAISPISPIDTVARFNKLYKDNQDKKVRKEELEKRVMKNIGASFTPKINGTRTTSARSPNNGIGLGFLLEIHQSGSIMSQEDRYMMSSRKSSPVYKSNAKKVQEDEGRAQLKKQFLNDLQKNLSGGGFGMKTKVSP